jgi:Beta propeller domain
MRRTLVLGTAALATTASLAVTVTGLATAPLSPSLTSTVANVTGGLLTAPSATAAELEPFSGCEELREWYVEQALPEVGPWGFGGVWAWGYGGDVIAERSNGVAELAAPDAAADKAVGNSDTGTNVQEAGVDEPDRAKTVGDLVVHLRRGELVVTDVSGSRPDEVGTLALPRRLGAPELLVEGDRILVVGQDERGPGGVIPFAGRVITDSIYPATEQNTRLVAVSVADPARPVVESDHTFGGSLLSARDHDGTVRLVLRTGYPTLDFVMPNRDRSRAEATRENRQIVRDSTIDDWLPGVSADQGDSEPLLDCTDVRHPREASGFGTISVTTFPITGVDDSTAVGVTAGGDLVYSSTDRLYVGTTPDGRSTELHAFALDGTSTSYVASGTLEGAVRDRWSIDEHDGVVRVAVAHLKRWETVDNGVTLLHEIGDQLVTAGSLRGLGPDEEIKSVRWFDDLAVLVTFRETDPLYTVDLRDPDRPRKLGELKLPGFSQYLHPVGDDRLLGLGQDADLSGNTRGAQASLFDLSRLARPERVATLDLGDDSELAAAWDPRTFTWLPEEKVGYAALDDWGGDGRGSAVVELRLVGDTLVEGRRLPIPPWSAYDARTLPLDSGRLAVVGRDVTVVRVAAPR